MNTKLIKYKTSEDDTIYIEVQNDPLPDDSGGAAIANSDTVQVASTKFEKALEPLKNITNTIIKKIKEIDAYPDEFVVELGLKFSAKAGIILTSVDSEANLKISIKWVKKPG